MALYAVFGQPVLHSKSPQMFRPLLEVSDQYTRIRPASTKDMIQIVQDLNIKGASITAPFKEEIVNFVDSVSEEAGAIGAVNCIRNEDGIILGHNTDHKGVTNSLEEGGVQLQGANILVLGAGGAAKAAVFGLSRAGANVFISNRTFDKAKKLAKTYGAELIMWEHSAKTPWFDAVVSTILPEAIPPFAGYMAYGCLLDAVYKSSKMSEHTQSRGVKIIPGERWLIWQGIEAARLYINNQNKALEQKNTPETLERHMQERLQPEKLRIFVLNEESIHRFKPGQYDLVVSGFGLNEKEAKKIIDEEKHLAFGN